MAFHPTGSKAGNLHSPVPYAEASGGPALPVARWAVLPILGPQLEDPFAHRSILPSPISALSVRKMIVWSPSAFLLCLFFLQ